jgi:hypothetical protein
MSIKFIKYKKFSDKTGSLIPFYPHIFFPKKFKIKRFFFLYGKKNYYRADHAHKKCEQIIIPIHGNFKITAFFKKNKKIFNLYSQKTRGIYIKNKTWIKINFKKDNDCIMVICNYKYDKSEYILSFKDFKKKYL